MEAGKAHLKNPHVFCDRVEYQSTPSICGVSSFKHLLSILPPRVHSLYYRDKHGRNISSSHLRVGPTKSELEFELVYPLFGGGKSTFVIGYGLPWLDFLFKSPDGKSYLNFTFGCPLLDTVVDNLILKVVLPEGSRDPSVEAPFPLQQHLESYSYLHVVGRTVVVLQKRNVVPEHNEPFQVYYSFNPIYMLAEPWMLVSVFFLVFMACMAYIHIDLSTKKDIHIEVKEATVKRGTRKAEGKRGLKKTKEVDLAIGSDHSDRIFSDHFSVRL